MRKMIAQTPENLMNTAMRRFLMNIPMFGFTYPNESFYYNLTMAILNIEFPAQKYKTTREVLAFSRDFHSHMERIDKILSISVEKFLPGRDYIDLIHRDGLTNPANKSMAEFFAAAIYKDMCSINNLGGRHE